MDLPEPIFNAIEPLFSALPSDQAMVHLVVSQGATSELVQLVDQINQSEVGRSERVLVEKKARGPGQILGRTRRNKVVAFKGPEDMIASYQPVRLTDTTGATFVGELELGPTRYS